MSCITHCDLTPNTVQPRQALVTFNCFVALVTLGWAVAFNPIMVHDLEQKKNPLVRGGTRGDISRKLVLPDLHPCSSWTSRRS